MFYTYHDEKRPINLPRLLKKNEKKGYLQRITKFKKKIQNGLQIILLIR